MTDTSAAPSRLLSYARLMRIPNVFTAFADIGMGLAFVGYPVREQPVSALLLLASSGLLYTAGMVLNDVFDVDIDKVERPQRPLPSGRIDTAWARNLGLTLLGLGIACGWAAGLLAPNAAALPWRSGLLAMFIAAFVVLYDRILKHTWLGPIGMGLCRFGNVLLGMSLASHATDSLAPALGYESSQLLAAGGIGIYIVGVTWFARTEATVSQRGPLIASQSLMGAGIVLLGIIPDHAETYGQMLFKPAVFWPVLLAALFVPIVRRGANAVLNPQPERVQAVVKNCIQSLILFDAAIAMGTAGAPWGVAVLALLAPMVLLGRWVYST
ncbi:MAG: UbiA family prenyltransferase [Pirellulales bacterium]